MEYFNLQLNYKHPLKLQLLDLSSFLYDFELLHDLTLLVLADDYKDYKFNRNFWFREGRPIKYEQKVILSEVEKHSPLKLNLTFSRVIALCGAFWILTQAFEKIYEMPLNHEKLRMEVRVLEMEERIKFYEEEKAKEEFDKRIIEKNGNIMFDNLINRLSKSPIILNELSVKPVNPEGLEESDRDN